jgi:arylsulfatase
MQSPPLPRGDVDVRFEFTEAPKGAERRLPGGNGALFVNEVKVAQVEMPEMHISTFSLSETFDVGVDAGTPVSDKYRIRNHFAYTGELDKVVVRLTD